MEPEHESGAPRPLDAPLTLLEHVSNVPALDFGELQGSVAFPSARALAEARRETQGSPLRGDDRALDHVLELTHVSRPVVALQLVHDAGGNRLDRFALRLRVALDEGARQNRNIVPSLPEGGHGYGKDMEAEEQVFAKPTGFDLLLEVPVGGGEDPHVYLQRLITADALELALLENAKEFSLKLERQLADLVEKDRAAVGELEASPYEGASRR